MAYLEASSCSSYAFKIDDKIHKHVEFALSRMRDPAIPRQLAAYTFLRLVTTSMQAVHRQGSDLMIASPLPLTYRSLAAELAGRDPDWWKRCHLRENGFLRSEDPLIARSLRPLNDFVDWLRSESPQACPLFSAFALNR